VKWDKENIIVIVSFSVVLSTWCVWCLYTELLARCLFIRFFT